MNITHCLLSALAGSLVMCGLIVTLCFKWIIPARVKWVNAWRPFARLPGNDRVAQIRRLLDTHCINTYGGVDEGKLRTIAAYWIADYELELVGGDRDTQRKVVYACDETEYSRRYKAVA